MTSQIKGFEIIGKGFPPEEGAELARTILSQNLKFDQLEVDLQGLPASLLISAFFNGFLSVISTERPELLSQAKRVTWKFDHDFQYENARRWINGFQATH